MRRKEIGRGRLRRHAVADLRREAYEPVHAHELVVVNDGLFKRHHVWSTGSAMDHNPSLMCACWPTIPGDRTASGELIVRHRVFPVH